ncbi:hypothetical protein LNTAR_09574 [Lentisphaera araneosa HTCC2155]|uniref:Uncharacterized protein n=1 Tax=Lentisphaera araneosa HTCC2155 TaxID=313628 RepID=A6DIF6_9BACT|nr:hypothetical protein [Lentisphaera araneosa]EDM28810.1 hypothetical protein LNTAR_09574 [Lentisphaera araneosa HTCC2155]
MSLGFGLAMASQVQEKIKVVDVCASNVYKNYTVAKAYDGKNLISHAGLERQIKVTRFDLS